jgi:type I restriction enzyme S subunit
MERMKQYVSGAVLPRIVLKDFKQFKILLPPLDLQTECVRLFHPLLLRCWRNIDEIKVLTTIRDTLLPKLLSGQIRVKRAEKIAEAYA